MKQIPNYSNAFFAIVLLAILFSLGLPGSPARAAQVTPAPAAAIAPTPSTQPSQPVCDLGRSVQVSGTAVINVAPDRALIQLGVQSNGVSPAAVESANAALIQAVSGAVRALGVDARDIVTDVYIIEPVYEDYDSLFIKGYRIHNLLAITLRDVSKSSAVISAALQAGANQVVNVDLYTSQLRKYRDQARELAMKAAREKAQALAKAAGAEAGCVLNINENTWSSYNGWWYGNSQNQNQWTQNVMQNAAPNGGTGGTAADGEPLSLGQISVRAEVSASFALR